MLVSAEAGLSVWGWFKPPHAPNSVALQLPPEIWQHPAAAALNVRQLALVTGIDALQGWSVYSQQFPLDERTAPLIDVPIPSPPPGVDPLVILWANIPVAPVLTAPLPIAGASGMAHAMGVVSGNESSLFEQMEFNWNAILQIESDLRRIRMQLEQAISRVSSLNRDLNTDEAMAADNNDKKDWQDARRWLRDSASGISRSVKEIDVGLLSGAGQRNRFEDMIRDHVRPRVPFPNVEQAAIDFEMFHKSAKNVMQAAQTALAKGTADGERRANAVLRRIASKARTKRSQRR